MKTDRGAEDSRSAQGRVRTPPTSRLSSTTIFFWRQRPTFASGSAGRRTDSSRRFEAPNGAVHAARVRRAPFRIGRAESPRGIGVRAA